MRVLNRNEPTWDRFGVVCDEYPFYSTEQGGQANYNLGRVSLKFVPQRESIPQGNLMSLSNLRLAGVRANDPFQKWYGVVAIPGMPISFWRDRQGNIVS
jgi:hypothetical protein